MKNYVQRVLCLIIAAAIIAALVPGIEIDGQTPAAAASSYFTDISGIPEEAAINRWSGYGVVSGSDGKFDPYRAATRIEFYAFINRTLGCIVKKDISKFTDIADTAWYYSEVQLAYAAGLTNGVGPNTFGASEKLKREMAVTIFGRIFGIYTENTSELAKLYTDSTDITYGRGYLAAFAQMGITLSKDGKFEPNSYMSRAEAVAFIDSFFNKVYTGSDILNNQTINGNALVKTPGVTIEKMTLNGNLILGDGIGAGNITLRNCVINGRLVIRGGGPNSINLSGTTVTNGIYIYNVNSTTRLYNTNSASKVGEVTAVTGTILDGVGSGTLYIPENAIANAVYTLKNVALDSVNVSKPNAYVTLDSGTVDNMRFLDTAKQSQFTISAGAKVNYAEIKATDVSVTGSGSIDTLYVGASGARVSMYPRYRYIAPGLTAVINGVTYSGSSSSGSSTTGTSSNVVRAEASQAIQPDANKTGGAGITMKTTAVYGGTEVTVTQDKSTSVAMTNQGRLGYWIGYFIPVPAKYQDPVVKATYSFEGSTDAVYSIPVETVGGVNGITMYIPVKAGGAGTGTLDTSINVVWGDATYENIHFYSAAAFNLAVPTTTQTNTLVSYFYNTQLRAYNNITIYSGSEALKRLLIGDNPLGLNVGNFESYSDTDQNSFVAQMYYDRSQLTSKKAIQDYIGVKTSDMGALYALNNAMTATAVRNVVENTTYASQLGIDTSSYNQLSTSGKLAVGSAILAARNALANTVFPNEAAVVTAFNKAVSDRRKVEIGVLSSINSAATGAAMQKVLENKSNADVLGIAVDSDPYKSLAAVTKLSVATKICAARQFATIDAVKAIFESLVGTPDNPIVIDPQDDPNILSVTTDPAVLNMVVGDAETIMPIITTSSGSFSTASSVTWSVDKNTYADVNPATGIVTAKAKGTSKITVTSKTDTKKKYTVAVNVVEQIPITSMTLNPSQLSISIGMVVQAKLSVVPAGGNDKIYWSTDDPSIATVSDGMITGVSAGFTNITARTASNIRAVCKVFVASDSPSVIIDKSKVDKTDKDSIILGVDCVTQLKAAVSPLTLSNTAINWSIYPNTVAEVDFQGNVKGKAIGYAVVTATAAANPDVFDTVSIHVKEDEYGVIISDSQINMYKNGTYQLSALVCPALENQTASDITWSVSGGTGIIEVDSNGVVKALGPGTAVVTASYSGNSTANDSCTVTVLSSTVATTVTPNKTQNIVAGESFFISVAFSPTPENTRIDYSSQDTNIAVVDENGKVTGVGKGTTMINVIPQANNVRTQITVSVTEVPVTGITILSSPMTVARGSQTLLQVVFNPSNATDKSLTWGSSSPYNVEVTKDGYIRALYPTATLTAIKGSSPTSYEMVDYPVTITAITSNGKTATCLVTVDERGNVGVVETMEILLDTWVFKAGTKQNLGVLFNGGDKDKQPINTAVTWTSTNEKVATVNSSGFMQTLAPGKTTITAVSEDGGKSSSKTIVVAPIGVEEIIFSPDDLDSNRNYGQWVQMSTKQGGNTKTIRATVVPDTATNKTLYWYAEPSDTYVTVSSSGKLTAITPGVATVTAVAQNVLTYGNAAPKALSETELRESGITYENNEYKDPNGNVLNPDKSIPAVIARDVRNSFMVWATPAAPESIIFQTMAGTQYINEPFTVTALMTPEAAQVDKIEWTFTESGGKVTKATSSSLTYTYTPTTLGNVTVACSVTMNEIIGPDTTSWPGAIPTANQLKLAPVTKSTSQTVQVTKRPITSLSFPPGISTTVYENQIFTLTPTITPSNATTKTLTWSSSDPMYADVNQNGQVTIKSTDTQRTVTITAAPTGDENTKVAAASIVLTIKPLTTPTNISISSFPATMTVGTTDNIIALLASGVDDLYTHQGVSWTTSDSSVLEITSVNKTVAGVKAKKAGKVTITATCQRNTALKATCEITVTTAATAGTSAPLTVSFEAAGQQSSAINALLGVETIEDAQEAVYTTTDPGAVTISDMGVITAVGEGEATVTATLRGKTSSIKVSVAEPEAQTSIQPTSIKLRISAKVIKGGTVKLYPDITPLNADSIVWTSSKSDVATVENGVVKGLKAGTATITLKSKDGKIKDTCTVTVVDKVNKAITSFKLNRTALSLNSGQSSSLRASVLPSGVTFSGVGWYSSDPAIAKVDVNGKVTGISSGKAVITAVSDEGGWTAQCEVTVTVKVTSIKLDTTTIALNIGETHEFIATVLPDNATVKTVTWKSSNTAVASVDANGNVKALKKGTATITATCDGKSVTCRVTVK